MKNLGTKLILLFAVFGILVSSYAFIHHYDLELGEFCSIGNALDCDKVNRSQYSEIFGVPVALLGVIFYFLVFVLTFLKMLNLKILNIEFTYNQRSLIIGEYYWNIIFYFSAAGLLFTFYLNFVEAFLIKSFCIVCLMSFAAVLGIFAVVFVGANKD